MLQPRMRLVAVSVTAAGLVLVGVASREAVGHRSWSDGYRLSTTPADVVAAADAIVIAESALPPDAAPAPPDLTISTGSHPSGALVLDRSGQQATIDCAGRDVLIHGDDGRFRLLNGCRAISVQGRGNRIQAELLPGARVSIGGAHVELTYTLVAPGAAPTVSVTATNSSARRVERLAEAPGEDRAPPQ